MTRSHLFLCEGHGSLQIRILGLPFRRRHLWPSSEPRSAPGIRLPRRPLMRELANLPLLGDAVIVLCRLYMPAARPASATLLNSPRSNPLCYLWMVALDTSGDVVACTFPRWLRLNNKESSLGSRLRRIPDLQLFLHDLYGTVWRFVGYLLPNSVWHPTFDSTRTFGAKPIEASTRPLLLLSTQLFIWGAFFAFLKPESTDGQGWTE